MNTEQMRIEFEDAYWNEYGNDITEKSDMFKQLDSRYFYEYVQKSWLLWQAALQAKSVPETPDWFWDNDEEWTINLDDVLSYAFDAGIEDGQEFELNGALSVGTVTLKIVDRKPVIVSVSKPLYSAPQPPQSIEADKVREMIAIHANELESNDYCYFELAYTRQTGWMAWICSKPSEDDPNRKVIAKGQGDTPDEACESALASMNTNGKG